MISCTRSSSPRSRNENINRARRSGLATSAKNKVAGVIELRCVIRRGFHWEGSFISTITAQIGCGLELIQTVLLPMECYIMLSILGWHNREEGQGIAAWVRTDTEWPGVLGPIELSTAGLTWEYCLHRCLLACLTRYLDYPICISLSNRYSVCKSPDQFPPD